MSKVAVVYWSGTGNTAQMAQAVSDGAEEKGAEVQIIPAEEFTPDQVADFDAIAFGCPAMGAEVLEESIFEPMFTEVEGSLSGKKVGLFGSYGWGAGAWMEDWNQRVRDDGANLVEDGVICENTPDDEAIANCKALGALLA